MIDCLSIVETDKVIHTVETDIVKLVVEIKSFDMSSDEFDKETRSSDGLQPKQADLSCVYALNEFHLHEIRVIPNVHVIDALHEKLNSFPKFLGDSMIANKCIDLWCLKAANPVEIKKLLIQLILVVANPMKLAKTPIR
ncbi:hypothetical protein Tco_1540368 [Tanacetum coccineum]